MQKKSNEKKIYISGKITGLNPKKTEKKFKKAQKKLNKMGYIAMNPAVLLECQGFSHSQYMHVCYAMLDACDAIYMLRDWLDSDGARAELLNAKKRGKEVIFERG